MSEWSTDGIPGDFLNNPQEDISNELLEECLKEST